MTKTREEWLKVMEDLIQTNSLEGLIREIGLIQRPDYEDLALFLRIIDNHVSHGSDIVLPAIALMATFFPDSVDIKFEEAAAENIFAKIIADGKLFES